MLLYRRKRKMRTSIDVNANLCNGCGECVKACPTNAIKLVKMGNRNVARVDQSKCVFCRVCETICSRKAVKLMIYKT